MKKFSVLLVAMGLLLALLLGDVLARGFGGFRGGFGSSRGGFDSGDRAQSFRAGEYHEARRAAYADRAFYAGGWGMDETSAMTSDDDDDDDDDNDDDQ